MVSEPEAFGLVYLEAMAKGCITIGTKGQGIDGVIIDGFNGFLCASRNVEELSSIFDKIRKMSSGQLQFISKNALETAKNMTDEKVAIKYLNTITDFEKNQYADEKQ
jgi:glycosyltransferase involved in cell wall biosynthesis